MSNSPLDYITAWPSILFAAFVILLTWLLQDLILTSPLRSIPGPHLARFTNIWILIKTAQGQSHTLYQDLHRQYGPIVRIGPRKVIVSEPEHLAQVYGTTRNLPKSNFYNTFQIPMVAAPLPGLANPTPENLFSTRNQEYHKRVKSVLTPAYSLITVRQLEPEVDILITKLIDQIGLQSSKSNGTIDLGNWLKLFAFDFAALITWHKPFGFVEAGHDTLSLIEDVDVAIKYASVVGHLPWLHRLLLGNKSLLGLLNLIPGAAEANAGWKVRQSLWEASKQFSIEEGSRGDLLSFLKVMKSKGEERISEGDVTGHLINNIFGGGDTSAVVLQHIFHDLLGHPEVMKNLKSEIDALPPGSKHGPIQFVQTTELPYIRAVIKESLRLHPPVPMPLEREVVSSSGLNIANNIILPQGTSIGISPSVLNLNTDVFGSDASSFRPERWTQSPSEKLAQMERCLMSFGAGSRMCVGRHIAIFELSKVVASLVARFDLQIVRDVPPVEEAYFFAGMKGQVVKATERS